MGAGGKSSLLERLAREYEAEGSRVVLTTTTHVRPPAAGGRPLVLVDSPDRLETLVRRPTGLSPVVGRSLDEKGKLVGVPPEWVRRLRELPWAAAVLVEADGAKELPLKAPAEWEPVLPECATLVVALAGLDAQGTPLDDEHVHRADLLAAVLDLEPGALLPPERLVDTVVQGYVRSLPSEARMVVALNKADRFPPEAALLRAAASSPCETWVGSVAGVGATLDVAAGVAGSWCRLDNRDDRPDTLVLAAGLGTRMGADKVLAPLGDATVLGWVVRAATGCAGLGRVLVVTGPDGAPSAAALQRDCPAGGYEVVRNPRPESGIASSLQVGLEGLAAGVAGGPVDGRAMAFADRRVGGGGGHIGAGGGGPGARLGAGRDLLVLLGDQPLVSIETLSRLVEARAASPRAAAVGVARSDGVGPPVLLHPSLRAQLRELHGDQGARRLLVHYAASVIGVRCRPEETLDVDTPAQLEQARRIVAQRATGGR